MERFTISLDEALAQQFDALIAARGYSSRSEAVRDLIRGAIEGDRQRDPPSGHCVGNLSYVFNHHQRELAERLTGLQHEHHDLTVAAMHSHLDHENCLESVILKGPTAAGAAVCRRPDGAERRAPRPAERDRPGSRAPPRARCARRAARALPPGALSPCRESGAGRPCLQRALQPDGDCGCICPGPARCVIIFSNFTQHHASPARRLAVAVAPDFRAGHEAWL
jgi:CopG family nickel-responsive transcriptional regulator